MQFIAKNIKNTSAICLSPLPNPLGPMEGYHPSVNHTGDRSDDRGITESFWINNPGDLLPRKRMNGAGVKRHHTRNAGVTPIRVNLSTLLRTESSWSIHSMLVIEDERPHSGLSLDIIHESSLNDPGPIFPSFSMTTLKGALTRVADRNVILH